MLLGRVMLTFCFATTNDILGAISTKDKPIGAKELTFKPKLYSLRKQDLQARGEVFHVDGSGKGEGKPSVRRDYIL